MPSSQCSPGSASRSSHQSIERGANTHLQSSANVSHRLSPNRNRFDDDSDTLVASDSISNISRNNLASGVGSRTSSPYATATSYTRSRNRSTPFIVDRQDLNATPESERWVLRQWDSQQPISYYGTPYSNRSGPTGARGSNEKTANLRRAYDNPRDSASRTSSHNTALQSTASGRPSSLRYPIRTVGTGPGSSAVLRNQSRSLQYTSDSSEDSGPSLRTSNHYRLAAGGYSILRSTRFGHR